MFIKLIISVNYMRCQPPALNV